MSTKHTIAFFGATGGVACSSLALALKDGHKCTALARTPDKLHKMLSEQYHVPTSIIDSLLTIHAGNIKDPNDVARPLISPLQPSALVDVIYYSVGGTPSLQISLTQPVTLDDPTICATGLLSVFSALTNLRNSGIAAAPNGRKPLLVTISTTGITSKKRDVPLVLGPLYHWSLSVPHLDKKKMEAHIFNDKGANVRDFVVVRPTLLTDNEPKGLESMRVGWEWGVRQGQEPGPQLGYAVGRQDVGGWAFRKAIVEGGWEGNGDGIHRHMMVLIPFESSETSAPSRFSATPTNTYIRVTDCFSGYPNYMRKKMPATHKPAPQAPSLPPELWIRILSYHTDLTHLWTTCRCVSPTFRAYTEQVFAEYVLRDTHIDWHLEKYNLGGRSKRPEVPVSYSHFSRDNHKTTVYFRDKRKKGDIGRKAEFERVVRRWEEQVRSSTPHMPNYTVRIAGVVNDTELPGLSVDAEQREIGFEWRGMFGLFFREQARLRQLKEQWHVDTAKKIQANNVRIAKGAKLLPSDYPQLYAVAEIELRRRIRRARLRERYQGQEELVWAVGALESLESHGGAAGGGKAFRLLPDSGIPGAGVGERWFGSVHLVQGLYLDEWSCMHRIDTKAEHLRDGDGEGR
ncbi:hypothetical protein BDV95DRAFT_638427 [Massariosphaeria phaeospora]|uniref:Uncharacterized protein n=1 Tax=Massariosphaeria phaeospora TaxID=100035 RepID=A0A7C8M718_9PLEO|nr:hypothetical protein BDV95DRAFT_638427 [Massariosphaeria phaeospora]